MLPRPEYPRPQFVREDWLNLNGTWGFSFDDENNGLAQRWFNGEAFSQEITVPFAFQSPLSGIGNNDFHDVVWYQKRFELPQAWQGKRLILHFGAVDYRAWVWVNGIFAGFHEGGHTPFALEISSFLQGPNNQIVLRAEDLSEDIYQPRGKQYWKRDSAEIFYTRTTGIWQTVWLEPLGNSYIHNLQILPDIDAGTVQLDYELAGDLSPNLQLEAVVSFAGKELSRGTVATENSRAYQQQTIQLGKDIALWSPESPALYDLSLSIKRDGQVLDSVNSYFGMRKISLENGKVCLNNQPYIMRLILDQGYHPQGILTFPSDEDFKKDIELTKALGFNGARKHQKIEDPRYLYWADKMGLLVWGEIANAYAFSPEYVKRLSAEWQEAVRRDYNHPCVVAWVPINESWGVPNLPQDAKQIEHLTSLYHLTKSLDTSRLIISNDGWEHARTDLLTIHDYESSREVLRERYASLDSILSSRPAKREFYVRGYQHEAQPILLTEFGGVAYRMTKQEGWGYSTASDEADFLKRLAAIMEAVHASPILQGFCYTQLTDVEQEINGLLSYERQPKAALETISRLIKGQ